MKHGDMSPGEAMLRAYADLLSRKAPAGVRVVYVPPTEPEED